MMQRLLVSVHGPIEAVEAAKGGALIAHVEYPASALSTPSPLNILSVRQRLNKNGYKKINFFKCKDYVYKKITNKKYKML